MALWEPAEGQWDLRQRSVAGTGAGDNWQEQTGTRRVDYGLTMAGDPNWTDYTVPVAGGHPGRPLRPRGHRGPRLQWDHYYYELLLGRDEKGVKSWSPARAPAPPVDHAGQRPGPTISTTPPMLAAPRPPRPGAAGIAVPRRRPHCSTSWGWRMGWTGP